MATISQGNGISFSNHYVGMCPNQPTVNSLGIDVNSTTGVNESRREKNDMNNAPQNLEEATVDDPPVIDVVISNVVCSFDVRCHLNLKSIALNAANVEFKREQGMVTMKMRNPYTTASIWSSGKIICTGATSEDSSKKAARRYARVMQKLGFKAKFANFKIINVLGTCTMPFGIKISQFSEKHRNHASYEPELHPGVTYKISELKATLKIFSTGSITITAPSVANVQQAVEHIFPLVYEFQKEKPSVDSVSKTVHGVGMFKKKVVNVDVSDNSDEEVVYLNEARDSDGSMD